MPHDHYHPHFSAEEEVGAQRSFLVCPKSQSMLASGTQLPWACGNEEVGCLSSADTQGSPMWSRPRLDPGKAVRGRHSPQAREANGYEAGDFHPAERECISRAFAADSLETTECLLDQA